VESYLLHLICFSVNTLSIMYITALFLYTRMQSLRASLRTPPGWPFRKWSLAGPMPARFITGAMTRLLHALAQVLVELKGIVHSRAICISCSVGCWQVASFLRSHFLAFLIHGHGFSYNPVGVLGFSGRVPSGSLANT